MFPVALLYLLSTDFKVLLGVVHCPYKSVCTVCPPREIKLWEQHFSSILQTGWHRGKKNGKKFPLISWVFCEILTSYIWIIICVYVFMIWFKSPFLNVVRLPPSGNMRNYNQSFEGLRRHTNTHGWICQISQIKFEISQKRARSHKSSSRYCRNQSFFSYFFLWCHFHRIGFHHRIKSQDSEQQHISVSAAKAALQNTVQSERLFFTFQ